MNGLISNPDKGAEAIVQMIKAGTEAKEYIEKLGLPRPVTRALTSTEESSLRDKLKKWLEKVRELAKDFSPESYSVTLSVPFVGSVSFSWPIDKSK